MSIYVTRRGPAAAALRQLEARVAELEEQLNYRVVALDRIYRLAMEVLAVLDLEEEYDALAQGTSPSGPEPAA